MDDIEERLEFEAGIIRKARSNAAFKKRLLADPRGTLEAEMKAQDPDASIPEGVTVRIVEEAPTEVCLVLPLDPESMQLGDEALDAVAGGAGKRPPTASRYCAIRVMRGGGAGPVCGSTCGGLAHADPLAGPTKGGKIGGS